MPNIMHHNAVNANINAEKLVSDIIVQLPGLGEQDIERAKKLIGATAQLKFRMVDDAGTNNFFNQFRGKLPEGFKLRRIDGSYLSVTHNDKAALKTFLERFVDDDHVIGFEFRPIYKNNVEKTDLDPNQDPDPAR